jgi:arylsulfatase A-like enzyme
MRVLLAALLIAAVPPVAVPMKLPSGRGRAHDGRPSFLIVRADELSAARLGCYGDRYALTPHIDALAAGGVRFTRALSAEPVCAAYRASFNLGLYTHATTNGNFLDPADVTIHDRLHAAGYRTAHVGKWHQTPPSLQVSFLPHFVPAAILDGLDYHGGHEQTHELVGPEAIYFENGVYLPLSAEPWRPQKHVDLALAQVDVAVAEGRPFYVVVDLEPPHFPYQDIRGTAWDVFEPGDVPCNPNVLPEDVMGCEEDLADYYSMVHSLDDMVGQLVAHLDRRGLLDSTVVVFTSDHGSHLGAHGLIEDNEQKRTPYRESIEVPLIVRRPNGPHGAVDQRLVVPVDYSAMILRAAGLAPDPASHHFDHLDSARLLFIDEGANTPEGAWYGVVRPDGMKYARAELVNSGGGPGPWLLFDTAHDPWELDNLVGQGDPREAEMQALLEAAAAAYGLTLPF